MSSLNSKPSLCLVTPALADANNGNWQTARRWARMLADHYAVRMVKAWPDGPTPDDGTDLLVALHARRTAPSIAAWARTHPQRPLVVALTGTDLYRDIATDVDAQRSLEQATRLIALQELGPQALPEPLRPKCRVVLQSSTRRQTLGKTAAHLNAVVVGHLRDEKWPQTVFEAARLLRPDEGITITHIGRELDPLLGEMALATQAACPHYRWLGGLPHEATRRRIQRAHVLIHPSRMEGGAHVIMEAALCGTPVLASRIDGNVGMLGADYGGYYPPGDAAALVQRLRQCRTGQQSPDGGMLVSLQAQCLLRAPLFEPAAERRALIDALAGLLQEPAGPGRHTRPHTENP
jgi:putative glycosyltransferase (TIGR04348 family)